MKNTYTILERNRIVEEHLWCIDVVMRQNGHLIKAVHLDRDDVYQQLAMRLIKSVSGYDPELGLLTTHIMAQLKYELLNCKTPYRTLGITDAPKNFHRSNVISLENYCTPSYEDKRLCA